MVNMLNSLNIMCNFEHYAIFKTELGKKVTVV